MSRCTETVEGKLVVMGEITTKEQDGTDHDHHMALLITFKSAEDIRQAIKAGVCRFNFS